jgi:hypothetical protein
MSHIRHTFHAHPTWFDFTNLDQCTFNPPLPTTYPYPPLPPSSHHPPHTAEFTNYFDLLTTHWQSSELGYLLK